MRQLRSGKAREVVHRKAKSDGAGESGSLWDAAGGPACGLALKRLRSKRLGWCECNEETENEETRFVDRDSGGNGLSWVSSSATAFYGDGTRTSWRMRRPIWRRLEPLDGGCAMCRAGRDGEWSGHRERFVLYGRYQRCLMHRRHSGQSDAVHAGGREPVDFGIGKRRDQLRANGVNGRRCKCVRPAAARDFAASGSGACR
jgi:hypothetical protein